MVSQIAMKSLIIIFTLLSFSGYAQKEFEPQLNKKGQKAIDQLIKKNDCAANFRVTYKALKDDPAKAMLIFHVPNCAEEPYDFELKKLSKTIFWKGLKSNKNFAGVKVIKHNNSKLVWLRNDKEFQLK